jgi:uncharacterized membrane protein
MTADAVAARPLQRTVAYELPAWVYPAIPLAAGVAGFVWMLHATIQRAYGMASPAWDFAYDQQVVYNTWHGLGFYSSFARANFLGIHFELILWALGAVEWLWPNPTVLLIFSAAGLAATAPAGYLLFRALLPENRADARWLAVCLTAPIPFWAATQEAVRDFFHPENMALALAMLAAWAGIRGHRAVMWLLCLLVLLCKEDQVYTVAVIGLVMRSFGAPDVKRRWRFLVYLAAGWFLVMIVYVQSYIRGPGYSDFVYYKWLFQHPTPEALLSALLNPDALLVIAGVMVSLGGMQVFAPRWLLLAIPPYAAEVLSGHTTERILQYHYVLLPLFPLIVAAAVGARNLLARTQLMPAIGVAIVFAALLVGVVMGRFPPALNAENAFYARPDSVAQLARASSVIPAGACVSADPGLAVWLADRPQINDFPDMLSRQCYVVLDHDPYISGPTDPAVRQDALDALGASGRRVIYDDGRFQVWGPVGA